MKINAACNRMGACNAAVLKPVDVEQIKREWMSQERNKDQKKNRNRPKLHERQQADFPTKRNFLQDETQRERAEAK